jgi:type VI secretion system protein ImpA
MAASPPRLDIDALLVPIPGDNPAGQPVPFDVREQFEEDRKEVDPNDFAEDDPLRAEAKPKRADWGAIIKKGSEILTTQSKDLLTAARITEALTRKHGFSGLRDGLRLLRRLVEECWDRVYPAIESEDDIELRAGPFNWLDDPIRGARFPNTLRSVPFVVGDGRAFGWLHWKKAQEGKGGVTTDDFDKAIEATPADSIHTANDDLAECFDEWTKLTQALAAKMGAVSPGLTGLRQALDEVRVLAAQVAKRKTPEAGSDQHTEQPPEEGAAGAVGAAAPPQRAARSREEAYRQLAQAAAVLMQLEPHSPIPYFVQRAVELGKLPFPQMIKALVREPNVLAELYREMGIAVDEPSGSGQGGS